MKAKLFLQSPVAILMLATSLATASAQPAQQKPPAINPTTGLPVTVGTPAINPATGLPAPPGAPVLINPATGLPLAPTAPTEPRWIDPNWPDPDIVLTNVVYDNLPLSEVANDLRVRFKDCFDILPLPQSTNTDWASLPIQLQLKDVKASEVFNAMNMVFENDQTPARWELKMNGDRPVALLRVLPEAAPTRGGYGSEPSKTRHMVYFVGDLLGDKNSGGMTMNQVVQTISRIWAQAYRQAGKGFNPLQPLDTDKIQFYDPAQLVIATGTEDELDLVQQTLQALKQKVALERQKQHPPPSHTAQTGSVTNK